MKRITVVIAEGTVSRHKTSSDMAKRVRERLCAGTLALTRVAGVALVTPVMLLTLVMLAIR